MQLLQYLIYCGPLDTKTENIVGGLGGEGCENFPDPVERHT